MNNTNEHIEQTGATLVVMQDLLDSLQRGENVQAVIKVLKDKFDFKTRYDKFRGKTDYELKRRLPSVIRERDDWVMRPWVRLGIRIHFACNSLFVSAVLCW